MNRIRTMVFGIFIMMLIMQLSCATAQEGQAAKETSVTSGEQLGAKEAPAAPVEAKVETSAEPEATPLSSLLADTHKAAGVECSDCHKETPPATETPSDICLGCHADYRDVALSYIDPHNAHIEFSNCGDCHHSHRESENQCMTCHSFNMETP